MAFLIVAAVLLVINAVFLVGSLIYTMKTTTGKIDPRLSLVPSQLDARMSVQPQELFYQAIVRMSGNPVPDIDNLRPQITEKLDNQTKQVAS